MTLTSPSRYDTRTALIVVDVQNDFADPEGSLSVTGGADAIPFINSEIIEARAGGAFVVYTQDWHPADTPHFAKDGGIWPVHCVGGTWGAALHPDLDHARPTRHTSRRAPLARTAIRPSRFATPKPERSPRPAWRIFSARGRRSKSSWLGWPPITASSQPLSMPPIWGSPPCCSPTASAR